MTWRIDTARDVLSAQTRKPVIVTRLYTGPDGQTHAEEIEMKFTGGGNSEVSPMLPVTGAELHRQPPNTFVDWHPGPRRQYVITLSGQGEIEVAGGKKIPLGPGQINLIEDTTGKGHITKGVGTEDRITLWLPLADQTRR
jgi:hypothetical protein